MDYAAAMWSESQPPLPQQQQHPHLHHHQPYAAPPPQAHHLSFHQPPPPLPSYSCYCPNPNSVPNCPNSSSVPNYPNASSVPNYPNPNPSPVPAAVDRYLPDPYAPHGGYSVGPASGGAAAGGGLAGYYYERVAAESRGLEVTEAIPQYGVDPIGYVPVPPRPSNGLVPAPPHVVSRQLRAKPNKKDGVKKGYKTTKVVQSAYCGVCKIDCNSQEVLNSHKQGKKHSKNLQKLQEAITPRPQKTKATTIPAKEKAAPVADMGEAGRSKKTKRKEAPDEDLEAKKRRVLEGGAEPNQVMVCTICNVVVNSQTVYDSHILGSKHAAMVKQQQEAAAS